MPSFDITSDQELEDAARSKTSYDADELPGQHDTGQMEDIIQDAKRHLYAVTGSDQWYSDTAYGQALNALTALKMKEAVENIQISSYGIGNESVAFNTDDPDDSSQIVSWSAELDSMLAESGISFPDRTPRGLKNTGNYVG